VQAFAGERLPKTQTFNYYEPEQGEWQMEFRLIYDGPLPPEKWSYTQDYARATDKHKLRKHFHLQLRELWKQHPDLRFQAETRWRRESTTPADRRIRPALPGEEGKSWIEHIADDHITCNGNRFVPLISEAGGFTCSLDILFLRRDNPGGLIENSGDIDSRIKVLLDGLRMPRNVKELGDYKIDSDEDPFFCLLEDDKLVTSVSVTTDRLIIPQKSDQKINDVLLVVHVTVVNPSAIFAGNRLV
jgi:hypothetical protein